MKKRKLHKISLRNFVYLFQNSFYEFCPKGNETILMKVGSIYFELGDFEKSLFYFDTYLNDKSPKIGNSVDNAKKYISFCLENLK
jgi:tetratricopeptide (TPR) repeat protein